jgi:hypothetical protein
LEINNPEECTAMENEFAEEIKKRGEDFKYYKDQVSASDTCSLNLSKQFFFTLSCGNFYCNLRNNG